MNGAVMGIVYMSVRKGKNRVWIVTIILPHYWVITCLANRMEGRSHHFASSWHCASLTNQEPLDKNLLISILTRVSGTIPEFSLKTVVAVATGLPNLGAQVT